MKERTPVEIFPIGFRGGKSQGQEHGDVGGLTPIIGTAVSCGQLYLLIGTVVSHNKIQMRNGAGSKFSTGFGISLFPPRDQ